MEKKIISAFILIALVAQAGAWGPATHRFVCDEAVKEVWGEGIATKCLPRKSSAFMDEFCELIYRVKGVQAFQLCRDSYQRRNFIHPANIPDELFNDTALFHDYSRCPIRPGPARNFLCGAKEDAPAAREAWNWFNMSMKADEVCLRVYEFCIGSAYYAKAENPLNQMKGEKDNCYNTIVDGVEEKIIDGKSSFRVSTRCEFKDFDYKHDLGVTEALFESMISTLAGIGRNISAAPLKEENKAVLLANSIDFSLNSDFFEHMKTKGITVTQADATNFETLKYSKYVIILGGHRSPEGVGEIVDSILLSSEKEKLLSSGTEKMVTVKENVWSLGQKVWVVAGYTKELTQEAVGEAGGEITQNISLGA